MFVLKDMKKKKITFENVTNQIFKETKQQDN